MNLITLPFERGEDPGQETSFAFPYPAVTALIASQSLVEQVSHGVAEQIEGVDDNLQAKSRPESFSLTPITAPRTAREPTMPPEIPSGFSLTNLMKKFANTLRRLGSLITHPRAQIGINQVDEEIEPHDRLCLYKGIVAHFVTDSGGGAVPGDDMGILIKSINLLFDGSSDRFKVAAP